MNNRKQLRRLMSVCYDSKETKIGRCETCLHLQLNPDGGHCYMFKEKPARRCAQWTVRARAYSSEEART